MSAPSQRPDLWRVARAGVIAAAIAAVANVVVAVVARAVLDVPAGYLPLRLPAAVVVPALTGTARGRAGSRSGSRGVPA